MSQQCHSREHFVLSAVSHKYFYTQQHNLTQWVFCSECTEEEILSFNTENDMMLRYSAHSMETLNTNSVYSYSSSSRPGTICKSSFRRVTAEVWRSHLAAIYRLLHIANWAARAAQAEKANTKHHSLTSLSDLLHPLSFLLPTPITTLCPLPLSPLYSFSPSLWVHSPGLTGCEETASLILAINTPL